MDAVSVSDGCVHFNHGGEKLTQAHAASKYLTVAALREGFDQWCRVGVLRNKHSVAV